MFGLGMGEIMVILIVALLVLGPTKLPDAAKQIGKAIRELRKHTQNLQETIEQDEHIGGTMRELKSALRGEPDAPIMTPRKPMVPPVPIEGIGTEDKPAPQPQETAAAEAAPAPAPEHASAPAPEHVPVPAPAPAPATPTPEPTKNG